MTETGTCPHCNQTVAIELDECGADITAQCPECGETIWAPADGEDGVWYANADQMPEYHKCSLCGGRTDELVGATQAEWYLCERCAGTPEAEAAGYTYDTDCRSIPL